MPRPAPAVAPKFAELEELREKLTLVKDRLRLDSLELKKTPKADIDYNLFIRVGSRELAVLDSLRYLRNIIGAAGTSEEVINQLQAKIDEDVAEAELRKTRINEYEQMLGLGAIEGYAIVQEIFDAVKPKIAALTV